jgi:hypothetical protein
MWGPRQQLRTFLLLGHAQGGAPSSGRRVSAISRRAALDDEFFNADLLARNDIFCGRA